MGLFRKRDGDRNGNRRGLTSSTGSLVTDLPIWPNGVARFTGGIFEVTTGDGFRVASGDILEIGVETPLGGRMRMTITYRAGLDNPERRYWVDAVHEPALRQLVHSVSAARGVAS